MRSESGFSLIELLIVILIIGILAAVLLPRLTGSTKTANEAAAILALRNYMQGELIFYSSHHGYGDPADLLEADAIPQNLANQLGASGSPVSTNGYEGSASQSGDVANGLGSRFAAELHPTAPGSSGDRYFATDGTVWESSSTAFSQANGELTLPGDARSIQ